MNKELIESLQRKYGKGLVTESIPEVYTVVTPSFTTEECESLFAEMTKEITELFPGKFDEERVSLMVHVGFADGKTVLYPTVNVPSENTVDNQPELCKAPMTVIESHFLKTGRLDRIHLNYNMFDTEYDFYYFMPTDCLKYENLIKERLLKGDITMVHEWYFVYTPAGATMGKHVDRLGDKVLRYSFAVRQPLTDKSITVSDTHYYVPQGTAYILNGSAPHEVIQDTKSARLMLHGAVSVDV